MYEMTDGDSEKVFEAGTVVNFESQFYGPRRVGITYFIDTIMFEEGVAQLPVRAPRELLVVG